MGEQRMTINFTLQPKEPLTVVVLQIGGVHIPCFADARVIMVDRNILSVSSNILNNGGHKDNTANTWWLGFLNSSSVFLNPALGAVEGVLCQVPTFQEFFSEFKKGKRILEEMFPRANVIDYKEEHYQGVYELVRQVTVSYDSDLQFLLQSIPFILLRNSKSKLLKIEKKLFSIAKSCGMRRPTLAFIACLSCLYESDKDGSPSIGRQVVKPRKAYTNAMAHNALMDLCALNLLIQGNAKLNESIGLCTADKGLIRFWCALGVHAGGVSKDAGFTFQMTLSREMFQILSEDEMGRLLKRIESWS